jgi:integrase
VKINAKAAYCNTAAAEEPARVKLMTHAELAVVVAAIPETHRLAFQTMAQTGCRISEALGLEWRDLASDGTLRIERPLAATISAIDAGPPVLA